ncbi:MAG: hypothetical protein A2542_03320 [Parcubacteria group bacterium RIFOXYD2_FULL_52_8]|nr:MAG: hypothetical protein A2542_03320 [Parcubacteria group bacterium RIFOXYD2_FULL_52_8]
MYFYATFLVWSQLFYGYGVLRGTKTPLEWRLIALRALDIIFTLTGVGVRVRGREHLPEGPVVFCANHQSFIDGLILFHVLRRPFTAITAPAGMFPSVLAKWFGKMGYITIGRDLFEELRYKGALEHGKSIRAAVRVLERGESLLIFPEGKREFTQRLLPFHAGVAKIAHDAKVPIIPITIEGLDVLFPHHSWLLSPARVQAIIEKPVFLHKNGAGIMTEVRELEDVIRKHLPARYFAAASVPMALTGKRAAFFDLDGTLTRKNIYQYIIMRYFRMHVSIRSLVLLLHLATKRLTKKHGYFYLAAVRLLTGIKITELLEGAQDMFSREHERIFYPEMLALLESHRRAGNSIFILSEEPDEILNAVLLYLNVPGFGTEAETSRGRFTGTMHGHIMKDDVKREKMLELARAHHVDLSKSFGYGNSWHDYAMLRTVGHVTVVNPERSLRKRARQLGYRIIKQA